MRRYAKRSKKVKRPRDSDVRKQQRAEQRRRALRETLTNADMTPTDAARAAGLPSANAIFNFLQGRSGTLSQTTLEKLAQAIPGASLASLAGLESTDNVAPPVRAIQVRAAAAAGLMQSAFDLPLRQQTQACMPISEELHTTGAFGVIVREPGAEKLFPEGSILVCVPMHSYDGQLRDGNKVILQRIVGGKVEVTVRELELQANEAWLWPRSTHHEHQNPVRMPFTLGQLPQPWRDHDTRYSLAAIVVGAYMPLV
jgi:hypothetical protein